MLELLLATALGAGALSNFPRDTAGKISHPAAGVTLDGAPTVLVAAGDLVLGYRADGGSPGGFPIPLGDGEVAAGAPAAADMDGDRRPEVAAVTTSGKVVLWSGGVLPGWPVKLGARARAGAAFADVDGDGKPELVVGDENGRLHAFKRSGAPAKGWPIALGKSPVTSTAASATFAGGITLAVGCEDGKVHVVNGNGRERPGFPLVTAFAVTGAPAFADLDDDGRMDLLVASQDFKLHAVDEKGAPLPGFPVAAGYRLYEGPAVVDLDGDGRLDVVFAAADGLLHAVGRDGRPLKGFPVRVGQRLFGGPAVGDLDRDGALDVAVTSADGQVWAVSAAGKVLPGFPAALGEPDVTASPLLWDLAGDGSLSAFVGTPSGQLHAVRAAKAGSAVATAPWPGPGHDAARSGRAGPNPPVYKDLVLGPAGARVGDKLKAGWRGVWLDAAPGEGVPAPRVEWQRDGKAVAGLEGKAELPAGTARRGERWRFVLSAPGGGPASTSAELAIQDTAPGAPAVRIDPVAPARGDLVRVAITRPASDADGDAVTYRTEWLLDGLETGVTGETFPGDRLRRGLLLTARVIASDGELDAPPALADARAANTAPGPLAAALEPGVPRRTDAVRAAVVQPATDVDGDPLTLRHRWLVDGKPLPLPAAAAEVPAGLLRKHQVLSLELRAFDGEAEGPPATAQVTVQNSAPGAPRVEILPARPRKGDALRASLAAPAEDADGDALRYTYEWRRDGQPLAVGGDGRLVAGSEVERGGRFEVTVKASDGEAVGPAASAMVTVVNTPPEPPRIAIAPRHPRGGEPLKLEVLAPATDADGDPVRLGIAWQREGKPTGTDDPTLPPSGFRKHERVRVVVTPHDGAEAGVPATDEVTVEDAPPGAPGLAFAAERPVVTAPLRVQVRTPAADPDGDALAYRYRWFRNGAPVLILGGEPQKESMWTSANEVPVNLLAKGHAWEVEAQAFDGEVHGPSGRASVVIANSPPPRPRVELEPARARRVDGLRVAVDQPADADGDHVAHRFTWTRNGQRVELPPEQAQIPRGVPRKGERWAVEVVALDGEAESPAARAELTVADTPPSGAAIALCDGPVQSGTVPEARVTTPATDADGDAVSYRYEWTLNGSPVPGATAARFPRPLKKHEIAQVQVTPWDGELAGPSSVASCEARNTPPTAPVAVLEPAEPTVLTGLAVRVTRPSADHDGDAVSYKYLWSRDGLPFALEGPSAPPRTVRHREVWRVEVVPGDGEAAGERVVLTAVIRNTPPPAPSVVVKPLAPTVGAQLACDATVPDRDADQEPVTLRHRWLRNDRPEAVADGTAVLPAGVVRRGERWRCEAWSSDGYAESGRGVAEVVVQNSPPSAPVLAIEPDPALTTDELTCRVAVPAVDPDGDEVTYTYGWWRNDRPLPLQPDPTRQPASVTSRGDRLRCAVTPSDGTNPGPAAATERTIANAPPGPARVRIAPERIVAGQSMRCEVIQRAEDPDGDSVRYRFHWQKNGASQPFAETSDEVPARMVKAGDRWRCSVVSTDGDKDGPEAGSEERPVAP